MRVKTTLLALFTLTCMGNYLFGQTNYWTSISPAGIANDVFEKHYRPAVYRAYSLNESVLRAQVAAAPMEGTIHPNASPVIIAVPNAAGTLERFRIVESPVMEQGLADNYPTIKTYLGTNIDRPGSTIRFDLTPNGFNAAILSADRKTIYVNMVDRFNGHCVVFDRDGMAAKSDNFTCTTLETKNSINVDPLVYSADDGQRRTYRLAVTVNGEFSQACLDGTEPDDAARKAKVLAVLVTDLNRANGIYDRDFGIRMNYITGMDVVLYLNSSTDPFSVSTSGWNTACRTTLTNNIGSSNFDIGHLVGKVSFGNENGNAGCIGCVCANGSTNGTFKGSGFTAHSSVLGDPLVVDYWAHEMGHQFGGNHTFTHSIEGTGANMEPGSGSTIMGYAGITGSTDVQNNSDDYFHAKSIDQITNAIKGTTPSTCATVTSTGNNTPVPNAGADYTIPKGTPFLLTGSATDANGDVLSYCWEQYDVFSSGSNTFPNSNSTSGPVFRSKMYNTSPVRTVPELSSILSGTNGSTWEVLPGVGRNMKFRLTVRDNSVLGAANQFDDMQVTVDGSAGPFEVTAPNSFVTWKVGEFRTITWNVAGSNAGSVNCANVAIELSTDGGNTFPVVLVASTPNDGTQEVIVPNNVTGNARVRIKGVGNIFFDISNSNFSIQAATTPEFNFSNPLTKTACSGQPLSNTVYTSSVLGFTTPINLTASGNPAGTSVVFSQSTITPGNSSDVSLQGTVPVGTHNITITGTAGSVVKTRVITFNVVSASSVVSLSSPVNGASSQPPTPTFTWSAVPGATSYSFHISTSPTFVTTMNLVNGITGTTYTMSPALGSNAQYYWKVTAVTTCGTLTSATRSFSTSAASCGNVASSDVPKPIDAAVPNTVTSTLNIPGSGVITDVDVIGLVGTHSWISDLKMTIQSPSFTNVTLFDVICDDEENFNLNLDDNAALTTFPCPPINGVTVKPQQLLSAFNGQNCNGTWTLTVQDKYSQDGGFLTGWGLKICISSGSLPVTWLDFTAKRNGDKAVLVQWSTAAELNNQFYEIQRSQNGAEFEAIGTVNAGNATTGVQYYLFNDLRPYAGVNYYRLKQVDKDGKFTYSSIVKVVMPNDRTLYTISPNPAVNATIFTALTEMKKVNVRMVDVTGKTVYTVYKPTIKPGETLQLPVRSMAKGYYLVVIDADNGRFTEKLIVQ